MGSLERCNRRMVRVVHVSRLEQCRWRVSDNLREGLPAELFTQRNRMDHFVADILHVRQCTHYWQSIRLVWSAVDHRDWQLPPGPWHHDDVFVHAVLALHLVAIDMHRDRRRGYIFRFFQFYRNMV